MRATVTLHNGDVRQVYRRRVGKGYTTHILLGRSSGKIDDAKGVKKWAKEKNYRLRTANSLYPFIILDTDTRQVNEPLAKKINKLGRKMRRYIWMGEGRRTHARQQQLWDEYVARNYSPPTVARPGTSNHETGNAADISLFMHGPDHEYTNVGNVSKARGIMRRLGLGLPVSGEPWHTEITTWWRA